MKRKSCVRPYVPNVKATGLNETLAELYIAEGDFENAFREYNKAATVALRDNPKDWKRLNRLAAETYQSLREIEDIFE